MTKPTKFYNGQACPWCEGTLEGGSVTIEFAAAYQPVQCVDCGRDWIDSYQLVGTVDAPEGMPVTDPRLPTPREPGHFDHDIRAWWDLPYQHSTAWVRGTLFIDADTAKSGDGASDIEYWCVNCDQDVTDWISDHAEIGWL